MNQSEALKRKKILCISDLSRKIMTCFHVSGIINGSVMVII